MTSPTQITVSSNRTNQESPTILNFNCCSPGAKNSIWIYNIKQGTFVEVPTEEESTLKKVGNFFLKHLCCCFVTKPAEKEKTKREEDIVKSYAAVEQIVDSSLRIVLPSGDDDPGRIELERKKILNEAMPDYETKKREKKGLSDKELLRLEQFRSSHQEELIFSTAQSVKEGTTERSVRELLIKLIPFINDRRGRTHNPERRFLDVKERLQSLDYFIPDKYIRMVIERILTLNPKKEIPSGTVSLLESIIQIALVAAAAQPGRV